MRKKRTERREHVGIVHEDGQTASILVYDRRTRNVERIEQFALDELAFRAGDIAQAYTGSDISFRWVADLPGARAYAVVVPIPEDLDRLAPPARRRELLASVPGLPNPDDPENLFEVAERSGIALIATMRQKHMWDLRDRLGDFGELELYPQAAALGSLRRGALPPTAPGDQTATLTVLCSRYTAAFHVEQRGATTLAHQVELAHIYAKQRAEAGQRGEFWEGKSPDVAGVDAHTYQLLVAGAMQEAYAHLYEAALRPHDIARVYVGGEMVDECDLVALLHRLADGPTVEPILAASLMRASNPDVARELAARQPVFAPHFALVAAAEDPDAVKFSADIPPPPPSRRRQMAVTLRDARAMRTLVPALLVFAIVAGAALGTHYWLIASRRDQLAAARRVEEQRAAEHRALQAQKDEVAARLQFVLDGEKFIGDARPNPGRVVRFLDEVAEAVPPGTTLDSLTYDVNGGALTITARADIDPSDLPVEIDTQRRTLGAFSERLAQVPGFSGVTPSPSTIPLFVPWPNPSEHNGEAGTTVEAAAITITATYKPAT